uniref:Rho-GAP domain-containing protein n=1 Tax=Globisporangium ultimum (strain ATCC 200006 / CBS 805.95 / DAOM BR144) TaxID=431595 RepID=K3W6A5_GLOUD
MAVGSVPGEVNDILYGLLNHTPQMARIQASYINDDVVDSQVLATVTQPSVTDPMRTLAVKWCVKRHNGIIRSLVRHRDFVFVEATGITTDANGERIGYHVIHSITVPQIRELYEMNIVRAKISIKAMALSSCS